MPAEALALIASAVISPPKSETPVTTLSAFADAFCSTVVTADAVVDCADSTEPSVGKPKTPPTAGLVFGGDETAVVLAPPAAGVVILIASERADAPGACAVPCASADPKASRASGRSRTRRRTSPDSARPPRYLRTRGLSRACGRR